MRKLKISHIKKSKEEYMEEALEYYSQQYSLESKYALDFIKYNLELKETKDTIISYHCSSGTNGEVINNFLEDTITNVDNVDYSEEFVRDILFYVMNTTGEEQEIYYKRLLFLDTWKWHFFNVLISDKEVEDFALSKLYRQWKIKKVLV
jgi:hypothetical protein